jgi:hypothetical protein
MTENDLQKQLFNSIKNSLPPHISLVDAIADLLNLSYDMCIPSLYVCENPLH